MRCLATPEDSSYPAPKRKSENRTVPGTLELDQEELDDVLALELQSSLDAPPKHYEFMLLVGENSADEIPAFLEKLREQVAEHRGKIWRLNDWGMRPLAYKIKKHKQANYFLLNVEIAADRVNLLNAFLQKDDRVIRHLMTKKDSAETKDYPPPVLFNAQVEDDDDDSVFEDDEDEDEEEWPEEDEMEGEREEVDVKQEASKSSQPLPTPM